MRMSLTFAGVLVGGIAIYCVYLMAGGTLGRAAVKAQVSLRTANHTHVIRSGDGGDCADIGTWDGEANTCVLTGPPPVGTSILVRHDHITLDGAGHTMAGDGDGTAILIIDRIGVTVRDLALENYFEGILVQHSRLSQIRNVRISGTSSHAIHLTDLANNNTVVDNTLGPTSPDGHGVALWNSHGNAIAGNVIVGTRDAVRLQSSTGNTITHNFTAGSMIEGIDLHLSEGNTILFNDIFETTALPLLDDMPGGANTYSLAVGGNHYSVFTTPEQGCSDTDEDGFCDEPYRFFSEGVDAKPTVGRWTAFDPAALEFSPSDMISVFPFAACTGCHMGDILGSVEEQTVAAPNIRSIVGKPVAGDSSFVYSDALRSLGGVWTEQRLHAFLESPQAFTPGTTMIGLAVPDSTARQEIIDYLMSLEDGPP